MMQLRIPAILLLAGTLTARAATYTCPDPIKQGTTLTPPRSNTYLFVVDLSDTFHPTLQQLGNGTSITLDAAAMTTINTFIGAKARAGLYLRWCSDAAGKVCDTEQRFLLEPETDCNKAYGGISSVPTKAPLDCAREASRWVERLRTEAAARRETSITAIAFRPSGAACYWYPDYPKSGDPIYVGVLDDGVSALNDIAYEPCQLQPTAPALLVSGTVPSFTAHGLEIDAIRVQDFGAKRCFNAAVGITAKWTLASAPSTLTTGTYPLQQYERFRGTLQLGVNFTTEHDHGFGLRNDGTKNVIYDQGPTESGPEYLATLVVYALPRQLRTLFGGTPYLGRDVLHDRAWQDTIGGVVGVGLNQPGRRFVAGASFEILYGINLIGTYEWSRVNRLAGVKEGDTFTGTADQIPTKDIWANSWRFGVAFDLRYATALFERK